jgi:hypothetical protein
MCFKIKKKEAQDGLRDGSWGRDVLSVDENGQR